METPIPMPPDPTSTRSDTGRIAREVSHNAPASSVRTTAASATGTLGRGLICSVPSRPADLAQAVSDARRGLRRAFKLGLVLTVIGIVAFVVVKKGSKRNDQTTG